MENYVIVKGSNDLLDREGKELFVGLRKNKFGFEGLAKDKQTIIDWFGNEVVLEKPTLDEIIVYTRKEEVPMRQLVYKDLFFFRVTWLVNFVMPLLLFMLDPSGEGLFPMSCLFITLSSVMTLIFMDERNKSDIVINSLPVSRKDIVIARYISCAIFIVGGMLSTMLVVFLIRGIVVIGDIGAYHP